MRNIDVCEQRSMRATFKRTRLYPRFIEEKVNCRWNEWWIIFLIYSHGWWWWCSQVLCETPTVVGGVDAFEQATLDFETGDAVPLAVKNLQPGKDRGVQLHQPVIPHVQLGDMPQQLRLVWHHDGDLIQPSRAGGDEPKVQLQVDHSVVRLKLRCFNSFKHFWGKSLWSKSP